MAAWCVRFACLVGAAVGWDWTLRATARPTAAEGRSVDGPIQVEVPGDDEDFVHFLDPNWVDDGMFDPIAHDPRRFRHRNATARRELEENSCENADGICCSLCKNTLVYCPKLAGYLVEDTYYPSEASVTGSCDDIGAWHGIHARARAPTHAHTHAQ